MKNVFLLLFAFLSLSLGAQPLKIILDADSGNEVDDLYAIVRALLEPSLEVTALSAAQWQASQWAVDESMEDSHRLNQMLVAYLEMDDEVPTLRGGHRRMYDWGDQAVHSAAAHEIIRQAGEQAEGEKLSVVVLGALTNVASAIYIQPEIAPKLRVYWLGLRHDFATGKTKRTTFNELMDPQATELMLNTPVEMHILPSNVAAAMVFEYKETSERLEDLHPVCDFLLGRWEEHKDAGRYRRTLWDIALVEALVHPELAKEAQVGAFENPHVWMYREINVPGMKADFFKSLKTLSGS